MKRVSVSRLEPHPKNARRHPEENIKTIVKSLKTFGQVTPLVINEKMQVLKGNGTLEAIKRLGWKKAKCIEVSLSPEEELQYALIDNKASDSSEFEFQSVSSVLQELKSLGANLENTGFSNDEIEPLLGAVWTPPDGSSTRGKGASGNYGGVQVNFNQSQKPVIDRAIKLYCNKVDNHRMTNADALYEIVREWMKSKTIKSKKGDGK